MSTRIAMTGLVLTAGLWLAGSPAQAGHEFQCLNGITALVHSPDEILANYVQYENDRTFLRHPAVGSIELAFGPEDPRVGRETDAFHPFGMDMVIDALSQMHDLRTDVRVEVFILPLPPIGLLGSYATGRNILLAPGFAPVPDETVHYITTHEMGHVLTAAFVDGHEDRWGAYLELRGLDPADRERDLPHRDRPREILAEDIRYLFGSALATASGTIENPFLAPPDAVSGILELLATFLAHAPAASPTLVASRAFPNPCNPVTSVSMEMPAGYSPHQAGQAELRLHDVRGRLIRVLRGGSIDGNRLRVRWDGFDDHGVAVASGRYLYTLQLGKLVGRGAVVIVR